MIKPIATSPSFQLTGSVPKLPQVSLSDKHSLEFEALNEQIKKLDQSTHDILIRLSKLHRKRTKFAAQITNFVNRTQEDKKVAPESRSVILQKERIDRLGVCTRLLDNKYQLSSLIKNQPLPDLQPLTHEQYVKKEDVQQSSDSLANFLRVAQPDIINNYFNETAIPRLLCFSNNLKFQQDVLDVDLKEFIQTVPGVISSVQPQNRLLVLQKVFDVLNESSLITTLCEETALLSDPFEILGSIEHVLSSLLRCKRAKLLIASDLSPELVYVHSGIRRTVPMTTGLIADTVKKGHFRCVSDPLNSIEIDVAVEANIFEGCKNAMIAPLYHPEHKNPFVCVGIDKLREDAFTATDYVLMQFVFQSITYQVNYLMKELTNITESDMTSLVSGLSDIAAETNAHDMIQKIIDVGNKLTESSITRLFTIVNDCMCEETPGTKLGGKMLPIDRGLVCKAAIDGESKNFFLPRREKEFSVSIDDITEPRIWSMVAAPTSFNSEIKGALVLYNRKNGTFFSAKEMFIISNLSKCICSLLYTCCECTKLHETLERDNVNIIHSYNLTVFALKSIQLAGNPALFDAMKNFCASLTPTVQFRYLVYENDKLLDITTGQSIQSEPQLLDAICTMKPTAATMNDDGILVLPVKPEGSQQINLFEFKAPLMQLKTEEERNGILQRTRVLQSLEEPTMLLKPPSDITFSQKSKKNPKSKYPSRQPSAFFNVDGQNANNNLPFIPLSLKSVHEENINSSSTSLFELSHEQHSADKFIIVMSARPSQRKQEQNSFETQLDEDALQIYPFDPFLTSILQSFSILSTRQLTLHHKIVSMRDYKRTSRALHMLGNVLACPMTFSDLLDVLMTAFTNLFGRGVSLRIFDPPLRDASDTDPTALNLERDRMIFASIKIPSAMTADRSTALASFADLLSSLMASRADNATSEPIQYSGSTKIPLTLDINFHSFSTNSTVDTATALFHAFGIDSVLNCSLEKIGQWMGRFAVNPDEEPIFSCAVDSLHFAYLVYKDFGLIDQFNPSELAVAGIAAFLRLGFPRMRPCFKYSHLFDGFVGSTPPQALVRVTTAIVILADPGCDLLADTPEEIAKGLVELMIQRTSISVALLISRFTFLCRSGLDITDFNHRRIFSQFVTEFSQSSAFFRTIEAFSDYCVISKESQAGLIQRAVRLLPVFVKAIESAKPGFNKYSQALAGKYEWIQNQDPNFFCPQEPEEEDGENLSLMDAR